MRVGIMSRGHKVLVLLGKTITQQLGFVDLVLNPTQLKKNSLSNDPDIFLDSSNQNCFYKIKDATESLIILGVHLVIEYGTEDGECHNCYFNEYSTCAVASSGTDSKCLLCDNHGAHGYALYKD